MSTDLTYFREVKLKKNWLFAGEYVAEQDYDFFARIADVRNYNNIEPIRQPRGLPRDCNALTKLIVNNSDRSRIVTYLELSELRYFLLDDNQYISTDFDYFLRNDPFFIAALDTMNGITNSAFTDYRIIFGFD